LRGTLGNYKAIRQGCSAISQANDHFDLAVIFMATLKTYGEIKFLKEHVKTQTLDCQVLTFILLPAHFLELPFLFLAVERNLYNLGQ
jgi:hypothetical protein